MRCCKFGVTLGLIYLALVHQGIPVFPSDVVRLVERGRTPFLSLYRMMPVEIRACLERLGVASKFFKPESLPTIGYFYRRLFEIVSKQRGGARGCEERDRASMRTSDSLTAGQPQLNFSVECERSLSANEQMPSVGEEKLPGQATGADVAGLHDAACSPFDLVGLLNKMRDQLVCRILGALDLNGTLL